MENKIECYVLGADDVGANHHRKRIWILAYDNLPRLSELIAQGTQQQSGARPHRVSLQKTWGASNTDEAFLRRGDAGIPDRVERIKGLGNAQVPAQMAAAFRILWDKMNEARR